MGAVDLGTELKAAQFGDTRLNDRACEIANQLEQSPNVSIPTAFRTKKELKACYRFFDNSRVTPDKILRPHVEATYERIKEDDFVLFVQDTTELDLTRPEQQVKGAGPMDCESRRGAFFHPVVAFTYAAVALGIVGQKTFAGDEISKLTPAEKSKKRRTTPIEEKESIRWLEGLEMVNQAALSCPETTCVCVGDIQPIFIFWCERARTAVQPITMIGKTRFARVLKSGNKRSTFALALQRLVKGNLPEAVLANRALPKSKSERRRSTLRGPVTPNATCQMPLASERHGQRGTLRRDRCS